MRIVSQYKFFLVLFIISTGIFSMGSSADFQVDSKVEFIRNHIRAYTYETNNYFTAAGLCVQCHGYDPNGETSVDSNGIDINVVDDWAGGMMANSARDPFWRAKVSHEILVNPAHQGILEQKCTSCHSPLGHFNSKYLNQTYSIAQLQTDSVGLDGVSCSACHQMKDTLIGKSFSGELYYDTTHTVYGPYPNPFAGPMQGNIGYNVVHGTHLNDAGLCAGCHTLITETVDLSGNPTGDHFVEQATYHEWLNSDFNTETNVNGKTCQDCHMPRTDDPVVLATGYAFLPPRSPFGKHHLAGANKFMLELMKDNRALLNLYSTPAQLDSAIARTEHLLFKESANIFLDEINRTSDTAFFTFEITNKTGHKFPSGYPSRRIWVEFVVMNDQGDTLFQSGVMNSNFEIQGQDAGFEPHHNMINQNSQAQIYEMVFGDVNNNTTTVLERGYQPLKDNRLVPFGFTNSHPSYDTVKIIGAALYDPDFNKVGMSEGTGKDVIHYHIPMNGYTGELNVTARLFYQSVPHRWLQEMFAFNSPEIDLFRNLFNSADHTPVMIGEIKTGDMFSSIWNFGEKKNFVIYPNPSPDGIFRLSIPSNEKIISVDIFNIRGQKISFTFTNNNELILDAINGTYFIRVTTSHNSFTEKIILAR